MPIDSLHWTPMETGGTIGTITIRDGDFHTEFFGGRHLYDRALKDIQTQGKIQIGTYAALKSRKNLTGGKWTKESRI